MIFGGAALLNIGSTIIGGLVKHWKPICVVLLILGNMVQWEYYWPAKVEHWQTKYNNEHAALLVCDESRAELKGTIEVANSQIDKWAKVTKNRQHSIDSLVAELARMKQKTSSEVQDILNSPTPQTCEAAIELLREAAQGDLKWKN